MANDWRGNAQNLLLAIAEYRRKLGAISCLHSTQLQDLSNAAQGVPRTLNQDTFPNEMREAIEQVHTQWNSAVLPLIEPVSKWLEDSDVSCAELLKFKRDYSPYQLGIANGAATLPFQYPAVGQAIDEIMVILDRAVIRQNGSATPRQRVNRERVKYIVTSDGSQMKILIQLTRISPDGSHVENGYLERGELFRNCRYWEGIEKSDDSHDEFIFLWTDEESKLCWLKFRQDKHPDEYIWQTVGEYVDPRSRLLELKSSEVVRWFRHQELDLPLELKPRRRRKKKSSKMVSGQQKPTHETVIPETFTPLAFTDPSNNKTYRFTRPLLHQLWKAIWPGTRRWTYTEITSRVEKWKGRVLSDETVKGATKELRGFWRSKDRPDLAERITLLDGTIGLTPGGKINRRIPPKKPSQIPPQIPPKRTPKPRRRIV
jgi:hypothetical protein